jgi:hypothetical protein
MRKLLISLPLLDEALLLILMVGVHQQMGLGLRFGYLSAGRGWHLDCGLSLNVNGPGRWRLLLELGQLSLDASKLNLTGEAHGRLSVAGISFRCLSIEDLS